MASKKLGLIVNPVAGLGGRVGLKGSDGIEIQKRARELGAVPRASERAAQALEPLKPLDALRVLTYPGEMGADAARACGLAPEVLGAIEPGRTTPQDTQAAARAMARLGVDLLLFAGGDGTARDVYSAVGTEQPALGIPAGVKIHSAAFGASPQAAGQLAGRYLRGRAARLRQAEVLDIDETALRQGRVSARLYGYLRIPFERRLTQGLKTLSDPGEGTAMAAIAAQVVAHMQPGWLYVLGPGTTTRAIADRLGLPKTLIGVDVVTCRGTPCGCPGRSLRSPLPSQRGGVTGELVAADVNESRLLALLEGRKAKIVVTPIGGQGYLFGRGNQQISPRVIQRVGRENLVVVSTPAKIHGLAGRPLRVDSGDEAVDELLGGYVRVVTGYGEQIVYRVNC